MKSNAPSLVASTAVDTVPCPEITTIGVDLDDMPEPLQHLDAVHAGHLDVEEHQVGRLALGLRDAVLAGGRGQHLVALVLEDHLQRIADRGFVVDDQQSRFHYFQRTIIRRLRR